MTAKIHSDHKFFLLSQQLSGLGLLHVYMLAIKQNLFFECLFYLLCARPGQIYFWALKGFGKGMNCVLPNV